MVAAAAFVSGTPNWMVILAHNTTSEAVSNGIWYEVLRRQFPYPRFIIAPEQRNQAGSRPDFTVFTIQGVGANLHWEPIFTFEGKAPYHAPQMQAAIQQASNYLPGLSYANQSNGRKFGMVASGRSVVLMVHNGGVAAAATQWNRGDVNIGAYNPPNNWTIWDIQNNSQDIDNFLTAFAQLF